VGQTVHLAARMELDGQARLDPGHRARPRAGAGPRGRAGPRAGAGARPAGAGRRARDQRRGADPLAPRRGLAPRALAARGARDGAGAPRRSDRRDAGGHRAGRGDGGRRGGGQVAALPRVRPALPRPGLLVIRRPLSRGRAAGYRPGVELPPVLQVEAGDDGDGRAGAPPRACARSSWARGGRVRDPLRGGRQTARRRHGSRPPPPGDAHGHRLSRARAGSSPS
jgi:hypothetical protein